MLDHVRCHESVDALTEVGHAALIADRAINDAEPLSDSIAVGDRCAAPLRHSDHRPADPDGRFLYYQRQIALNALIETRTQQKLDEAVENAIVPAASVA